MGIVCLSTVGTCETNYQDAKLTKLTHAKKQAAKVYLVDFFQ